MLRDLFNLFRLRSLGGDSYLATALSVDPLKSRVVFLFPGFRMGLKRNDYLQAKHDGRLHIPADMYQYRGATSAMTAFQATKGLIAVMGRVFDPDELQSRIVLATDDDTESFLQSGGYTHYVLVGTRSHAHIRRIVSQYGDDFEFGFDVDNWRVIDKRTKAKYSVPDPSQANRADQADDTNDFALIEKVVDPISRRVVLVLGGMWDTGTLAAGQFLLERRKEIAKKFRGGGFQYLLEIPAGSTRVRRVVVERAQGEPPARVSETTAPGALPAAAASVPGR
jgi:hypothetical protein